MKRYEKLVRLGLVVAVVGAMVMGAWLILGGQVWDGRSRFTVVDVGPPVIVSSFDPATHKGLQLQLPDELEVVTSGGRGKLPAGSLVIAGSRTWAAESVANYLGIFYQGEQSQLKWRDKLWWWWSSRQVEWQTVNLGQGEGVNYYQTPDGVRVGELAPTWEYISPEWFTSLVIAQQQLSVKVVNTTPAAGLAAAAARAIESSGMKVIEATNSPQEVDTCELVAPTNLYKSVGVQLLQRQFHCDLKKGDQLTIYLGKQYRFQVSGEE